MCTCLSKPKLGVGMATVARQLFQVQTLKFINLILFQKLHFNNNKALLVASDSYHLD